MQLSVVLDELKEKFHLKESHIAILEALKEKDLTADDICSRTKIPKGNIYELLNELMHVNLIKKIKGIPSVYSGKDIKKNTIDFLKHCFDDLINKEMSIMNLLDKEDQQTEVASTNEKCVFKLMESLARDSEFNIVLGPKSVPFFFYPTDDELHLRMRRIHSTEKETFAGTTRNALLLKNSYEEACKRGKKFRFLITEDAFRFHMDVMLKELGKLEVKKVVSNIKEHLKRFDIGVRLTKGHSLNYTYCSDNKLFIVLLSQKTAIALIISSKTSVNAFTELFEEVYADSKDVKGYLNKVLKSNIT